MSGPETNAALILLGKAVYYGAHAYVWLIILRVGLGWLNPNPYSPLMRFLARAADPALKRARRHMPLVVGGLDFSPILALVVISFTGSVLGRWLWGLGLGAAPASLFFVAAWVMLSLLRSLAWMAIILMVVRLLMSLVRPSPYNMLVQIIYGLTEPLLAPLRRAFPPGPGGLDFRPLVFLLILFLVEFVVLESLESALRGLGS